MTHEETVEVPLIRAGADAGTCSVRVPRQAPQWMEATLPDGRTIGGEGEHLIAALGAVRTRLHALGLDLACQGCRADIHASPMMLESTGGRFVYRTRPRVQARREDVVDLLDATPPETVAGVDERAARHARWLDSLGATAGERKEAKSFPNGWIYRIDEGFDPNGRVPPEAIIGAFEVGPDGVLTGRFERNEGFRPGTAGEHQ